MAAELSARGVSRQAEHRFARRRGPLLWPIIEAIRDARPARYEYELQVHAEYTFKKSGAYGPSYFALIATGPDTFYSHGHKDTAQLQTGPLIQLDYAPALVHAVRRQLIENLQL